MIHPLTSAYPRPPCSPLLRLAGPAWAHTKTPPPPVGWAQFSRNAEANLLASTHDSNELGNSILKPRMAEVLNKLKQQLADANAQVADPDRQLVLLASRLPKLHLPSWPSATGNGETNYCCYAEMHPQTGQVYDAQVARQDIVREYAGLTAGPEALVQRWLGTHMAAKFGADEAKWQTEGQWAMAQSPLERQRAAQQAKVDGAYKALVVFSTRNPLGYVSEATNAQGKFNHSTMLRDWHIERFAPPCIVAAPLKLCCKGKPIRAGHRSRHFVGLFAISRKKQMGRFLYVRDIYSSLLNQK